MVANFDEMQKYQTDLQALANAVGQPGCLSLGCFAGGTKLLAPDGPRAIEDFKIGDPIIGSPGYRCKIFVPSSFRRRVSP